MNVTVMCEHNPSMDSEEGRRAYPEGLGVCLKEMLSEAGIADMARGETLTPAQFARLADVLTEHRCTDGQ